MIFERKWAPEKRQYIWEGWQGPSLPYVSMRRRFGRKKMLRNKTKEIRIGKVCIGGEQPVAIQSMTNTKTEDVKGR